MVLEVALLHVTYGAWHGLSRTMGQGARLCEQGNDALIGKNLKGQRLILLAHVLQPIYSCCC